MWHKSFKRLLYGTMSLKVALILGLCLLAGLTATSGERARYDNYRIYKTISSNEKELALLKELENSSDSIMFLDGVHGIGKDIKVVVAPHKIPDFLELMGTNEIEYELLNSNLQALLEDDDDSQIAMRDAAYGWTQYYELEDTYKWLQSLATGYPGIVTLIEGGKTYQRRSILGVKISYNNGQSKKPGIFLEAGIHAREWIAPATATYIINQLLTSNDASIKNLGQNYDWYIFPHANPDGYVYTHKSDRMWRKTRKPHGTCFGVDPNRNWDFHWNEIGASSNPCSDTYAGPAAFSDIESRSLSNYISSLKGKIQLYISFHSYSQYLLYPYGHTNELPDNVKDYRQVYNATVSAINKRYGTKYTGGNIYDAIYPAAGSSVDWAYGKVGVRMAYCFELRPSSGSVDPGSQLPASQIIPTAEETLDGVVAMVSEVKTLGYFN